MVTNKMAISVSSLDILRAAGAVHRDIRQKLRDIGLEAFSTDVELARYVEKEILVAGYHPAFPCMISVDDCVAHWTPGVVPKPLNPSSLWKIDFGLHRDGHIIDAAFSFSKCQRNQQLIRASERATEVAISMSGVDAYIPDIGGAIQEYLESKEIDGTPVKSVWDVCGHQIERWKIHGRKVVPNIRFQLPSSMRRMAQDEVYAIEPHPTLGDMGDVRYDHANNQVWMLNYRRHGVDEAPAFLRKYRTLPFCKRWEPKLRGDGAALPGCYDAMPPIYASGVTAQTEHNIYVGESRTEVLTR